MVRQVLTDNLLGQLQETMREHSCYQTENSRIVMEAILWKLYFKFSDLRKLKFIYLCNSPI